MKKVIQIVINVVERWYIKQEDLEDFQHVHGYPECKNTMRIVNYTKAVCPKCGGRIEKRKGKRKPYYICENNPKNGCDYISWKLPKEQIRK